MNATHSTLLLYWHTLRYLKAEQILFRLWRKVWRPRARRGTLPALRPRSGEWTAAVPSRPCFTPPDRFDFLGQSGTLSEIGWDGPQREKLWRYNQHYFAALLSEDSSAHGPAHRTLIANWIAANPPGHGTAWEAYPTSLRIVAWIKWALAGQELSDEAAASLADQARWLSRNLERHILGNHLLANAKALTYAGAFFDGPEARSWLDLGLRLLDREVPEQVLPDGGHFELSPMYHILILEDLLDLINLAGCFPAAGNALADAAKVWGQTAPRMLRWMTLLSHPDGEIAFFNDAAFGIAPTPAMMREYAARLGLQEAGRGAAVGAPPQTDRALRLPDSGYARLEMGSAVLLADTAAVGPDYLPGHAHADTLSFEFSLKGRRLIVNSGTSVYGTGVERLRQRGTKAHSTLVLNEENSSEVWSGFRVARRARVHEPKLEQDKDRLRLAASHDGYARLAGAPLHHREWSMGPGELVVQDRVAGRGATSALHNRADVIFLLAPAWRADPAAERTARLTGPDGTVVNVEASAGQLMIENASWHPGFGRQEQCQRLRIHLEGALPMILATRLSWDPRCDS